MAQPSPPTITAAITGSGCIARRRTRRLEGSKFDGRWWNQIGYGSRHGRDSAYYAPAWQKQNIAGIIGRVGPLHPFLRGLATSPSMLDFRHSQANVTCRFLRPAAFAAMRPAPSPGWGSRHCCKGRQAGGVAGTVGIEGIGRGCGSGCTQRADYNPRCTAEVTRSLSIWDVPREKCSRIANAEPRRELSDVKTQKVSGHTVVHRKDNVLVSSGLNLVDYDDRAENAYNSTSATRDSSKGS
ncbi:hypothetical protein C8R45DRAFT_1139236 [Mycena sanguinolenta]|nr:hypothetical protein C8R45DRAFT_1139236 [Mycena sanguinolenta]